MSRKDFKRGFEAAINAQKGFNQKQAEATEELGKRIGKKFDEFGDIIDFVIDDLNVSEKKRLYNLNNTHDINELGEQEKILLLSILYVLIKEYGQNNEYQKKYYFSVKKALDIANPDGNIDVSAVANVDNLNDSKVMYRVVCEFLFLAHSNHECGDLNDEILSNFNVNKKSADDILNQIIEVYNVFGIDGILNHYNADENANNDFEKETNTNINDGPNFVIYEDITISSMTHIAEGETLEYRNKNITIESIINCEGTLSFHSCNITFNSPNKINEIELKDNATLVAKNCKFICLSHIDKTFIKCGDLTSITFDKCQFNDCSYFIRNTSAYIKEFSIINSTITNCSTNFVYIDNYGDYSDRKIIFKDNTINNESLSTDFVPKGCYSHSIIYINNQSENTEVCVSNNLVVEKSEYREKIGSDDNLKYFVLTNSEVSNCTFIGAKYCVEAIGVYDCVFKNCSSPIVIKYKGKLKNCLFRNCISSINSEYGTTISNSKFIGCKGNLFDGSRQGGSTIEYCEVINHINTGNNYTDSSIIFNRDGDKNSKSNTMKNCIFNGCVLNKNYLVSTHCYEKPKGVVAYIENCNFRNIKSKENHGKIIREKDSFFGFLDVKSEIHAISIFNCDGIENVNKEDFVADKSVRDSARELESK